MSLSFKPLRKILKYGKRYMFLSSDKENAHVKTAADRVTDCRAEFSRSRLRYMMPNSTVKKICEILIAILAKVVIESCIEFVSIGNASQ